MVFVGCEEGIEEIAKSMFPDIQVTLCGHMYLCSLIRLEEKNKTSKGRKWKNGKKM